MDFTCQSLYLSTESGIRSKCRKDSKLFRGNGILQEFTSESRKGTKFLIYLKTFHTHMIKLERLLLNLHQKEKIKILKYRNQ